MKSTLEQLDRLCAAQQSPTWIEEQRMSWHVRLQLLLGHTASAAHRLSSWMENASIDSPFLQTERDMMQIRCVLSESTGSEDAEAYSHILSRLQILKERTLENGWLEKHIQALLLENQARAQHGEQARAMELLDHALRLGEDPGYIRLYLDESDAVARLLRAAAFRRDLSSRAREILDAASSGRPAASSPLTDREMEILALMADGCTNEDISRKLFITVGTVKVHSSNLFRKLGVSSRTQAAAWGRELGLLD